MKFDDWKKEYSGIALRTGTTASGAPYEVVEQIGVLGTSKSGAVLEVNRISFNGRRPMLDIRRWAYDEDGNYVMKAGISMNESEVENMKKIMWG